MTATLTAYDRPYRSSFLNLMYESRHTHTHLDWHSPLQWLETGDHFTRLLWQDGELLGFVALSLPLNGTSWLRLSALSPTTEIMPAWRRLWKDIREHLGAYPVTEVYVLVVDTWLTPALMDAGFTYVEDVVTLYRPHQTLTPPPTRDDLTLDLDLAYSEDIEGILPVDHDAFAPPWQLTRDELWQAMRQASHSTVARHKGRIIGYQISTRHNKSGHLARLAVARAYQGRGIGGYLLNHLIQAFERRHIKRMTVNTQRSNWRSQRLYQRYGFQRNGFDLSVWRLSL